MKGYPVIHLLATATALLLPAFASAEGCDTNAQKRHVVGPQPTANALYAHIQHVDMGSWPNGFDEETFTYLGEVNTKSGKSYKIGYLKTTWGLACRATNRLFIFDANNNYLGQYAGIAINPRAVKIQGSVLIFPLDPKDGNKLDLSNGPPAEAWLDGDNPEWSPAPPPK